jgi:hypothetical protein
VQFHDYGTVLWSPGSRNGSRKAGNHCDFRTYLTKRERELSLALVQRCSFLIMEQCCGPLAVEFFPGNHCDFSTYLPKRARAQSGACPELQFPVMEQCCGPLAVKIIPKTLRFQHLSCQECESSVWSMGRGAFS